MKEFTLMSTSDFAARINAGRSFGRRSFSVRGQSARRHATACSRSAPVEQRDDKKKPPYRSYVRWWKRVLAHRDRLAAAAARAGSWQRVCAFQQAPLQRKLRPAPLAPKAAQPTPRRVLKVEEAKLPRWMTIDSRAAHHRRNAFFAAGGTIVPAPTAEDVRAEMQAAA